MKNYDRKFRDTKEGRGKKLWRSLSIGYYYMRNIDFEGINA